LKIVDLEEKHQESYFICLEGWSNEIKEAKDHKENWYNKMKEKNYDLGVKLAINDKDEVVGMIQYIPIEISQAKGEDLYYILCIWVHGYEEGVGNYQKRGIGKQLLKAAEEDVRHKGGKGLVAWGVSLPFWMKASWFKKQGYQKIDRRGISILLWKPFSSDVELPHWIKPKKLPKKIPGKVLVTAFINGWCPAQNTVFERAKRAAQEFREKVIFQEIDTFNRQNFEEWGIGDALFIDGKEINTGPPPSFEKLKKKIEKRVKKIK